MGAKKITSVVIKNAATVTDSGYKIIRFRGRALVLMNQPFPHYVPLRRELFDSLVYPVLGGVSRSAMSDLFAYISNTAPDMTDKQDYILFGKPGDKGVKVWDMTMLKFADHIDPEDTVWRSPFVPQKTEGRIQFIMDLAGKDEDLYDDIVQSMATLVMARKPDGVIWWVGDGANGKSTLMDAIYKIFPGQLSSITVKRLVDGRDTPSLNGTLGNVVKESSEGRVDDTEIYKSIGTHENFKVHRFHSQDDIEIEGNIHHIFSANIIPTFNDKGYSSRRRTFIVPFNQHFESDPTFEDTVFTPELFSRLVAEICKYAQVLKRQGFRYKWSATTLAAKANYDVEASNAEEYAREIIKQGVIGFDGFAAVKVDYENWCADHGYVPLGITNLRRALSGFGFIRSSTSVFGEIMNLYKLPSVGGGEMQRLGMHRIGLYTVAGWMPEDEEEAAAPEEKQSSILEGRW